MTTNPTGTKLSIIPGDKKDRFTLGYLIAGKPFRDQRFSPVLHHYEAVWLFYNEQREREVDGRFRNSTAKPGRTMA